MEIIRFNEINSTNIYLKNNYKKLDNLTVVVANHQTDGKGRLGRTWVDNDDLLFSILIKENINKPTDYSLLIASTLLKVLKDYYPKVKWPNDIMVDDKKICGVLLEAVTEKAIDCVVIGVGININTESFPNDLLVKATSLKQVTNKRIDKEELLNNIINAFSREYDDYINNKSDYISNIINHFFLKDKNISFEYLGKIINGKVIGMSAEGELLVESNKEIIHLRSGEVTLENVYKK